MNFAGYNLIRCSHRELVPPLSSMGASKVAKMIDFSNSSIFVAALHLMAEAFRLDSGFRVVQKFGRTVSVSLRCGHEVDRWPLGVIAATITGTDHSFPERGNDAKMERAYIEVVPVRKVKFSQYTPGGNDATDSNGSITKLVR